MKCQSNYKSENYPLFNCNKRKLNFKQKYIFIIIILINIIKISPYKVKESFQIHSNEITKKFLNQDMFLQLEEIIQIALIQ